jgi:hypothetical protein
MGSASPGPLPPNHLAAEPIQKNHRVGPTQARDDEPGQVDAPELAGRQWWFRLQSFKTAAVLTLESIRFSSGSPWGILFRPSQMSRLQEQYHIINKYLLSQVYPIVNGAHILMMVVTISFLQLLGYDKIAGVVSIFLGFWFLSC